MPSAPVELIRDNLGITHVRARTDRDAMYGAGYAMARDRLFQMELTRRQAQGRLAEIFGSDSITDDIGARTFNFMRLGRQDAARLYAERPADFDLIQAWIDGVNQRITEVRTGAAPRPYGLRPGQLDFVPAPWRVEDTFAIGKVLSLGMSNTLDAEILSTAFRRLVPDVANALPIMKPALDTFTMGGTAQTTVATPRPAPARAKRSIPTDIPWFHFSRIGRTTGSNNWAVDGAHTDNGRPLVAGDPHQPLGSPSLFYPFHMTGDTLDAVGFAFVGTPIVELGHNAHVGWTATTNFADVMDLWDVQVDADFQHARIGNQLLPVQKRTETIYALLDGQPYGKNRAVTVDIHEVPGYGVFLPEEVLPVPRSFLADGQLLFNWTGFRPTLEVEAYLGMDRARSLEEWEAAANLLEVGAANFVAADATGIEYHVHALVPDRGPPSARPMPWRALPGNDPANFWTGAWLGPDKLPHQKNPARGYLVTANNDPWGFTSDGNVENDPFYYGAFYDKGFRAHHIEERLQALMAAGKVTRADMETLQGDVESSMADFLAPRVVAAAQAIGTDPQLASFAARKDELQALATQLSAWDRRYVRDAPEPVIFVGVEWFATKRAFEQAVTPQLFDAVAGQNAAYLLGLLYNLLAGRIDHPETYIPDGEHVLLVSALADAADWLNQRFGSTPYHWSDLHAAAFHSQYGSEADGGLVPVDGTDDTINVSEATFFSQAMPVDRTVSTQGPLYRMVIGFGADGIPDATVDFTRGTSEDPADPHFNDRQDDWVAARHVPMPFRTADVDGAAAERIVLPAR